MRPSMRGGVPVLSRPTANGSSRSVSASFCAGGSPARPAACCVSPTWILPARNVPAVSTTAAARNSSPLCVRTPTARPPSTISDVDRLLEQREVRLRLNPTPNGRFVQNPVGLATRRAHGRTLRRVQRAPLDAGVVRSDGHDAAERVDFPDQMALADPADRGIAAHLADRLDVVCQQQRARADPRARERGFGAGVAAADDDDVVVLHEGPGPRIGQAVILPSAPANAGTEPAA